MVEQAAPPHPHMHDFESHVRAVEEDLEYYRVKRFEPRVLYCHRRGVVTLYDVLRAAATLPLPAPPPADATLEQRIRALEDGLDAYVRGNALGSVDVGGTTMVIEDTRTERGDYHPAFRIAKKAHGGTLEERVARLEEDLRDYTRLQDAFLQAMVARGALDPMRLAEARQPAPPSPWNGARIVARAWVDPEFLRHLLEQGREAVRELDIPPGRLGKLGIAVNTEAVHNVVVCTLCSCYPYDLLGDTPWWYKHDSYKQQIVRDPRGTLAEMFGLQVPEPVEIRVHDSTSDVRWMVIPRRPAGTESWSEEELARLVTQESLIGVAEPLAQAPAAAAPAPRQSR